MKSAVVVGSLNLDYSIALKRMPQPGETIAADSLTLNPGGKGANQAYALGKLGCRTAMIGAVGRDGAGETLIRNLQSAGVDCSGVFRREEPTGQAFITVDGTGGKLDHHPPRGQLYPHPCRYRGKAGADRGGRLPGDAAGGPNGDGAGGRKAGPCRREDGCPRLRPPPPARCRRSC